MFYQKQILQYVNIPELSQNICSALDKETICKLFRDGDISFSQLKWIVPEKIKNFADFQLCCLLSQRYVAFEDVLSISTDRELRNVTARPIYRINPT